MELDTDAEDDEPLTSHSSSTNAVPQSSCGSGLSEVQRSKPAPTETVSVHTKPLSTPNILTSPLTTAGSPQGRSLNLQKSVAGSSSLMEDSSTLMEGLSQRTVDTLTEIVEQKLAEITGQAVVPQSAGTETSQSSIQKDASNTLSDKAVEETIQTLQEAVFRQADELKKIPISPAPSSTSQKRRKGRVPVRRLVSKLLSDDEASDGDTCTSKSLPQPSLLSMLLSNNVGPPVSSPVHVSTSPLPSISPSVIHQPPLTPPARANSPLSSAARTTPITSLALSSSRPSPPLASSSIRVSSGTSSASTPSHSIHAHTTTPVATTGVVSSSAPATSVLSASTVAVFTTEASTGQTLKVSSIKSII